MGEEAKMATLHDDIAAYDTMSGELELDHFGKWVVFHDAAVSGFFEDFQAAATAAVKRFGRGPYLIRQIGAPPAMLPMSVLLGTV